MPELGDHRGAGFYEILPTPPALIGGLELLTEALGLARTTPSGFDEAEIEAVISSVTDRVNAAAQETAMFSERTIVSNIETTRLRPEAHVDRKRLADGIKSESLGMGSVGIGAIEDLDTVVGKDGKPFWRAQEFGSTHLVGRSILGLFQPGTAVPSEAEFRQHPIFEQGEGMGLVEPALMRIKRPIPARHFLRDGTAEALLFREKKFGEAEAIAIGEMRAIQVTLAAL